MIEVLLVSPKDPDVPENLRLLVGGENTYTQTLLDHPPAGVRYTHHLDALKNGEIEHTVWDLVLSWLGKFRLLPLSAGCHAIRMKRPFDLIHCHAYTLMLVGKDREIPVVMGDSIPSRWSLLNYFKQHPLRIEINYKLRKMIHGILAVNDQDLGLGRFSKLMVMSQFAKQEHIKLGMDASRIEVLYPGLPDMGVRRRRKDRAVRLLFAGVWFRRKGGFVLLEAYRKIKERFGSKVQLTILGPVSKTLDAQRLALGDLGIEQHDFVSYSKLVGEFYPNHDVLVHVPPKAEGYGLVVQEAMSFGLPIVGTRVGALPEIIVNGKTGLLVEPGNVSALEKALENLIENPELREGMGGAAREYFLEKFSLPIMQKKLMRVYREALGD